MFVMIRLWLLLARLLSGWLDAGEWHAWMVMLIFFETMIDLWDAGVGLEGLAVLVGMLIFR
jgi:hypothetical protein